VDQSVTICPTTSYQGASASGEEPSSFIHSRQVQPYKGPKDGESKPATVATLLLRSVSIQGVPGSRSAWCCMEHHRKFAGSLERLVDNTLKDLLQMGARRNSAERALSDVLSIRNKPLALDCSSVVFQVLSTNESSPSTALKQPPLPYYTHERFV
jgi:hypothetical protein